MKCYGITYVVGSSTNNTAGLLSNSKATHNLFRSPPDMLEIVVSAFVVSKNISNNSFIKH